MSAEIHYYDEPVTPSGPVRMLMSGGRWLVPPDQRPADWKERERERECAPVQKRPIIPCPLPAKVAKPKPPKPSGAWKSGKSRPDITVERIQEMRGRGMLVEQIAAELGCNKASIFKKLRKARSADKSLLVCACGRSKLPSRTVCRKCRLLKGE